MAKLTIWQNGIATEAVFSAPEKLDRVLEENHIYAIHPCGGRGVCGKCEVTLSGDVSQPNQMEQKAGIRLSCQAVLLGDAEVWLPDTGTMEQIEFSGGTQDAALRPMEGRLGCAVDIGTTTIAVKLYDLKTGECLAQSGMENPQRAIAADVMGRIQAALEGQADTLQQQVQLALQQLLAKVCAESGHSADAVDAMVVAGNTTMLYLLTGQNPESLSHAPFRAETLFDEERQILGALTYLPPCMNAFVGADITAAVLSSGMCERNETALLCDIGTNGEIALWKDGKLYVSSTAAGPAFEGAGISCGCGSVRGAVDSVWLEDGKVRVHTIGEVPAVGVCGSGLLDAIAVYLQLEEIDETGAMEEDELPMDNGIALEPRDVRSVQLAKAAIAAGIETLIQEAGIEADEVETLYIAGGFGSHLNIESAVKIGLIPEALGTKVEVIGNAALAGAVTMLLDQDAQRRAAEIAAVSSHINLGGNRVFNDWYIEKMMFE